MFLVYRINEGRDDYTPVMPDDALFDVFQRFHPHDLDLLVGRDDIADYRVGEHYIDSGDWMNGYSTYYNIRSREKVLVVDTLHDHDNPTIKGLIRQWRLSQLWSGRT